MALKSETGGLIDLDILKARIGKMRSTDDRSVVVSDDDVQRAIETLRPLCGGYRIVQVGRKKMVQSVPREMSDDQSSLINSATVQCLSFVAGAWLYQQRE